MNGVAQLGSLLTVELNTDPGKPVGMTIFNDSGASPVQIGAIVPMLNVLDSLYRAQYTPIIAGSYLFRKAVYTDGTFTVLDPNYLRASEAVQVLDLTGGGGGGGGETQSTDLVGTVDVDLELVGTVDSQEEISCC